MAIILQNAIYVSMVDLFNIYAIIILNMQVQNRHERLVEHYVEHNLSQLHLPHIPLSVPSSDETLLLNCRSEASNGKRRIIVVTEEPGKRFVVTRRDDQPIQVKEMNSRSQDFDEEAFYEPIQQLILTSLGARVWQIDTESTNIRRNAVFDTFLGHVAMFAVGKQNQTKQW